MDFIKLEPASDGREDVLVLTDVFTKWTMAIPTRDQSAMSVTKVLIREWIPHYGVPRRLHSNQGKCFEAEQKHRWPEFVSELVFWYNSTPHSTTGQSPYFLLLGCEPRLPIDVYLGRTPAEAGFTSAGDYLARHLMRLGEIHQLAEEKTKRAAQQRETPMPRGATQLKAGDLVLAKRHLPGRVKIQDIWSEKVYVVVSTPPEQGGPFVIRPRDEDGVPRMVTGSVIRLYIAPVHLPQGSVHKQVDDTDTSSQSRPISAPRRSSRSANPPNKLDF
ncbi:Pol polyprotein [Plakobranchus ocellatus]|uniref:Pol polyprotein n=1 Tax=Plakobranchus ocellatus TaxID=259542 RepID=A0AAV3ZVR3_9GAST|nr:Pol polyprotein [Plakobranchus ocellatus]